MTNTEHALIVAGGKGSRMSGPTPKQFIELNGLPVLFHTIRAFRGYSARINVVLVLPALELDAWAGLCAKFGFKEEVTLQSGGDTRFQSVQRGLEKIAGDGLVAIHDGVRPLVSEDIIAASFRLAAVHGSAVASVRLKESIRMTDQDTTHAVDRSKYRMIQTPQTFRVDLIKEAYRMKEDPSLTDDASVAERAGQRISLFEGSDENIKITNAVDLDIASALLAMRTKRKTE